MIAPAYSLGKEQRSKALKEANPSLGQERRVDRDYKNVGPGSYEFDAARAVQKRSAIYR